MLCETREVFLKVANKKNSRALRMRLVADYLKHAKTRDNSACKGYYAAFGKGR